MRSRLPFDEINALEKKLRVHFDEHGHIRSRKDCEEIIDEMLDLFMLAMVYGVDDVNEQFGTDLKLPPERVQEIVYKPIDGATWADRVWTWYDTGGTIDDILRIADTETTRISNAASLDTATRAGAKSKVWATMLDDKVRDTHSYLEGVKVPIDAAFYTFDGDNAMAPGGFVLPQNNINCRCELIYE